MKTIIALLFIYILSASQVMADLDPVTKIIEQKSYPPITITDYSAEYNKGSQYETAGIYQKVKYKNTGNQQVVAVSIGLLSFDVWNEFIDRTNGVSLEEIKPGKSEKGTWIARAYGDFAFHTGFAYVSKVRFADGTIWAANLDEIAQEIRKIEKDFDIKKLSAKTEK